MLHTKDRLASSSRYTRWALLPVAMVVCLWAIVLSWGSAIAQSARDGFDPGADGNVRTLAVQPDGKLLIGGEFTLIGASARNRLARLEAGGGLDTTFNPNLSGPVYTLAVQGDGSILAGGDFLQAGSQPRSRLVRLSSSGAPDATFTPAANGAVHAIAVLSGGKLLVAGQFTQINSQPAAYLARLSSSGALEATFAPAVNGAIYALAVQRNGAIVIGGAFTQVNGQPRNHIARLDANGTLDASFNPDANATVRAVALQFGGLIVLAGDFTQVGGQSRTYLARVTTGGAVEAAPALVFSAPVHSLLVQADDRFLVGGEFLEVGGQPRTGLVRFAADGAFDATFAPNPTGVVYAMLEQPDGKLAIGGAFLDVSSILRRRLARLYEDGSLDADFDPVADGGIKALALQLDGKVLVGGAFATIDSQARKRIARLLPDGALDATFAPVFNDDNPDVWAIAVQPDGKILVGGSFATVGGQAHQNVVRLDAAGGVDAAFTAATDGFVLALALQPDGKILLGGDFQSVNGQPRRSLARLNSDGSLDTTFRADTDGRVVTVALQADGKIIAGGEFGAVMGALHENLVRLHASGAVDETYNPSANAFVYAVGLQADDRALVGGTFFQVNGVTRNGVARLNTDGTLDTTFNPNIEDGGFAYSFATQTDGKIIVAGNFTVIGGQIRNRIARFTAAGQLDTTFNPNVKSGDGGVVFATALQKDGKLVIGGGIADVGGVARTNLARLSANTSALYSLYADAGGGAVVWAQSGGGPNLARTTFAYSLDGVTFTELGAGTRTATGWQAAATLPFNQEFFVRARGAYASGGFDASVSQTGATARTYAPGGVVEIVTTVSPAPATPAWRVTATGVTTFTVPLTGAATTGVRNVGAGVYTFSLAEAATLPTSEYATTYTCLVDGAAGPGGDGASVQVTVNAGSTIRCTFANTRRTGGLTVAHRIEPSAANAWNLTVAGPSASATVLTGDANTGQQNVFTGEYVLNLAPLASAYYATEYACTVDGQSLSSGDGAQATVVVAGGRQVTCTFTSRDILIYPPHRVLMPDVRR